ncbi:hypothetical protein GF420_01290 [candidate division GN15 bacterium]|nr:hypothetical protein [candidate division GN15 bacterium]
MSQQKNRNYWLAGATMLLVGALLVTGCSRSPMSDTASTEPVVLQRSASAVGAASLVGELYTEATISAEEGGQLVLLDVVLEVPPGAVPNDTLFSIEIPDLTKFHNDFGTEGLVFDKPVTVTMSYRDADLSGIDESSIRVGYFNEQTGEWEGVVCQVDPVNKLVTAELHHFSAYGLISDEPGGGY